MPSLHKILHIDDDAVMRLMVKKSLERSDKNFEVISCSNEAEFMDALNHFKPDLFIIDIIMPLIDGPNLLKKLRVLQNKTPAIFMTGQEYLDLDDENSLHPVIGLVHKPFSPLALGDELIKIWNKFHG